MAHLEKEEQPLEDAGTIDNIQSDTVDDMLRDMIAPVLAALEFDDKDENLSELMFNTMQTSFRPSMKSVPGPCKVCNGRHDADACRVRGIPFLPEWLLKNVKQYNGVHSDKPRSHLSTFLLHLGNHLLD